MSFEALLSEASSVVSDSTYTDAYDGARRVGMIGLNVNPKIRALELQLNWARLAVDMVSEVLTVEGFESSLEGSDELLKVVSDAWARNRMGMKSHFVHTEAFIQGEAFIVVGTVGDGGQGQSLTTVHPRDGFAVSEDSDGNVVEALVTYTAESDSGSRVNKATYYTREKIYTMQEANGVWHRVATQPGYGLVPVIPVRNKSVVGDRYGRSEMDMVLGLGDAGSRAMTMLQVAMEILATPQRYIAGADGNRFKRPNGDSVSLDELYLGSFLMIPDSDAKLGQFPGADLSQIVSVVKTAAEQVSAMTGIPPTMLGVMSDGNPTSAEAMRAAKERMISRCEAKQVMLGDVWTQWAKVVLAVEGFDPSKVGNVSTVWRDVASSSVSARSANLLQAHAQGVVSARTARDALQLTPEQKKRENAREERASGVSAVSAGSAFAGIDYGTVVGEDVKA